MYHSAEELVEALEVLQQRLTNPTINAITASTNADLPTTTCDHLLQVHTMPHHSHLRNPRSIVPTKYGTTAIIYLTALPPTRNKLLRGMNRNTDKSSTLLGTVAMHTCYFWPSDIMRARLQITENQVNT